MRPLSGFSALEILLAQFIHTACGHLIPSNLVTKVGTQTEAHGGLHQHEFMLSGSQPGLRRNQVHSLLRQNGAAVGV